MHNPTPSFDATTQAYLEALPMMSQGGARAERGARILFECLVPQFHRYFVRHGQDPQKAEDLTQEAFLKVVRQLSSVRNPDVFLAWAFSVARNTLRDEWRASSMESALEETLDEEQWAAVLERHSTNDRDDLLTELCMKRQAEKFLAEQPERAFCLERVLHDGWTGEQMAEYLGRTAHAAAEYVSQCRQRFIAYLQACWQAG